MLSTHSVPVDYAPYMSRSINGTHVMILRGNWQFLYASFYATILWYCRSSLMGVEVVSIFPIGKERNETLIHLEESMKENDVEDKQ